MKKLIAIFTGISACIFTSACSAPQPAELPSDAILLDVRSQTEYQSRRLENSILIPHDQLSERSAAELPNKNAAIIIYCRSGRRSAIAAEVLKKAGYTNVTDAGSLDNAAKILKKTIIQSGK